MPVASLGRGGGPPLVTPGVGVIFNCFMAEMTEKTGINETTYGEGGGGDCDETTFSEEDN